MTDSTKNKIAEAFIAALRAGNKSGLRAIMVDDIVWSLPESSTMSGDAFGVDAILRRFEILRSYGVKIDIEHQSTGCAMLCWISTILASDMDGFWMSTSQRCVT